MADLIRRLTSALWRSGGQSMSPGRDVAGEEKGAITESVRWLDELAAQSDWRQIPRLLDALAPCNGEIRAAGERAAGTLISKVPVTELPHLEQAVRDTTFGAHAWYCIGSTEVTARHRATPSLALLSMHANGYIRQPAVERLDASAGEAALPFLLLRLNDWVPEVRGAAERAVHRRLTTERLPEWAPCLGLIEALQVRGRADHRWVSDELSRLLRQPGGRAVLEPAFASPERRIARAAFRTALKLEAEAGAGAGFIAAALSRPDPVMRLHAARAVRERLDMPDREALLSQMARDRFMPVRREALYEVVTRPPPEAMAWLTEALLDRHPSMRHAARVYLRGLEGQAGFDPRAFYLERLRRAGSQATRAMVAAVAEVGQAEDADHVVPYLKHPREGVAAAAVRAIAVLEGDRRIPLIQGCFADPRPAVGAAAARALASRVGGLEWDQLRHWLGPGNPPHTRRSVLSLMLRRHPHDAIPDIIAAACSDDAQVAQAARNYLAAMRSRVVSCGPSEAQARAASDALERWRDQLPQDCQDEVRRVML